MRSRLTRVLAASGVGCNDCGGRTRAGLLSITVSIGVASALPGATADDMLAGADAALYRAKAEGRNCVAYDDSPCLACRQPQ